MYILHQKENREEIVKNQYVADDKRAMKQEKEVTNEWTALGR